MDKPTIQSIIATVGSIIVIGGTLGIFPAALATPPLQLAIAQVVGGVGALGYMVWGFFAHRSNKVAAAVAATTTTGLPEVLPKVEPLPNPTK